MPKVEERECRRDKDFEKANLICGPPRESKRLRRNTMKVRDCNEGNKQRVSYEAVTVALGDIIYLNCMIWLYGYFLMFTCVTTF